VVLLASYISLISCSAVQPGGDAEVSTEPDATSLVRAADRALPAIVAPAVVYVGEVHDQYGDHINQLAVISALRERNLNVAVGLEMIQTPFQAPLDRYIEGALDLESMLAITEYFDRWRYDPRLYAPIFEYARQHRLPLLALNAPRELTDRVSEVGIAGLTPEERAALPTELTPLAPEYRALLEQVFGEHGTAGDASLDRFIDVQTTWDEVMGRKSAEFLQANPDHVLVVLAGVQHVAHGHGIPARVENASGLTGTIVLTENERERLPGGGDVYLETTDESLPDAGRLGVYIETTEAGPVIAGFADDSPASEAGAEAEDIIVRINDREVDAFGDIKLELWDQLPGDPVRMAVQRGPEGTVTELSFELR